MWLAATSVMTLLAGCQDGAEVGELALTILDSAHHRVPGLGQAGETYSHRFVLRNDTNRPVEVAEIERSCGCAEATIDERVLLPGERAVLEVTLDTTGRSGPVEARVVLLDPQYGELGSVVLSAIIEEAPTMFVSPASVLLPPPGISGEETAETQVVVQRQVGYSASAPTWVDARAESGSVLLTRLDGPRFESQGGGESWVWTIALTPTQDGEVDDVVRVTIHDGREQRETRLVVRRPSDSWFLTNVDSYFAGVLEVGSTWSVSARVQILGCPTERLSIQTTCEWLDARVVSDEHDGSHVLRVTATPPASARGDIDEAIRVTCDALPEVAFRVRGMVR